MVWGLCALALLRVMSAALSLAAGCCGARFWKSKRFNGGGL